MPASVTAIDWLIDWLMADSDDDVKSRSETYFSHATYIFYDDTDLFSASTNILGHLIEKFFINRLIEQGVN